MSTYQEVLDFCRCGHRGFMHAAYNERLWECVAVDGGKACGCRRFKAKEAGR